MVRVQKLTAETLLSDPIRGPAVPNSTGTHALYTVSTHKFGDDKTAQELRVISIANGSSVILSNDGKVHDARWIPGTQHDVIYLKSADKGHTEVIVANGQDATQEHYLAAEIDAPVANPKLEALDDGNVVLVVTGLVGRDGSLYNDEAVEKKSSARVYDHTQILMGNELYKPQRHSLWYNKLFRQDGRWKMSGHLYNLVEDPTLEVPGGMYGMSPSEALSNFDICHKGIAFSARILTQQRPDDVLAAPVYFVPIESFTLPPAQVPKQIAMPPHVDFSISGNIRFTPDASIIGFLSSSSRDPYSARLYLASVDSLDAFDTVSLVTCTNDSDRNPPTAFEFAGTSDAVILLSQELGRWTLSHLKLQDREKPTPFFTGGASAFYPLVEGNWDTLLTTSSSFIDSSVWQIIDVPNASVVRTVSSATKNGAKFGLTQDMVTDFWYGGGEGCCVHCWMIRPSDFDENKKYPWIVRPHDYPVSAWNNEWTTEANFATWAEQGYVVLLPNITGSVGYGHEFTQRINGQWEETTWQDLLQLIHYVDLLPYLDQEKAVFMAGSYAGHQLNWLLGHSTIEKFCCVVCHDGIFNIPTTVLQSHMISTQEPTKPPYPWNNPEAMEEWKPVRPERLLKCSDAPPTLIIHSEKDYRCPMTEGLEVFKALQAQGVPSRFLTFPDEGHVVLGLENALAWYDVVGDWVKRCVDGDIKRGDTEW